jgi:serine/threonine protein kinase/Flp pilus assembly protein TadD
MPIESGQMLSHYRLVEMIGEGGMSVVWKGIDTRLDREVAIKILSGNYEQDPERLALFESEAKIVAALNHPNIVTIYSIEEDEGLRFITMELVRGKSLDEVIAADSLPLKRFFELAIPMSDAISAAHERGVTHGDLKPSNVMVSDDGPVKILDFGLARIRKVAEEADSSEALTITLDLDGRFAGTMAYMSPEQIQMKSLDGRSDIFTLGIIFYEMVTGRRPFSGESSPALLAAILKDTPVPTLQLKGELPRHLDRIISRCLEKEPRRRVQTALDLCNELQALERECGSGRQEAVRSIAVLPFTDLSPEKDQDHFCEGIAEEIINALVKIKDLRVAARTSSFPFKGAVMDSRELGDRLSVGNLLHGSVRKAGDRLRISAELINVADGYRLWSERYDRELKDIFAIQDEIAQSIVDALEVTLSPMERRAIKQVATTNVEAYDYYLRGRKYFSQYRRQGIQFALQMFSRAIEFDPSYALAYAGIADCASFLYLNINRNEAIRAQADAASKKALELDPELAEAHSARGVALSLQGLHDEAEEAFENSIRLNPKLFDAHYFYARDCFTRGDFDKAIRLYEQAAAVSPEDYQSLLLVAQVYSDLGREEQATGARRRGVRVARERLELNPDDLRALYMGANGLVALGEREKGLAWAKRAMELEPDEPMLLYNLACIYALAEETETAIACLEKAIDRGFAHRMWLEKDSNLDSLRDDGRFQEMVKKLG